MHCPLVRPVPTRLTLRHITKPTRFDDLQEHDVLYQIKRTKRLRFQFVSNFETLSAIMNQCNQCMFCDKRLKSTKQLHTHETKCELYSPFIQKENDGTLKCTKCFRNFENQRDIFLHMKREHLHIVSKNGRKYVKSRQPFDEKTKRKKFNDFVDKINGKWSRKLCDKKSDTRVSHRSVSQSEIMEVTQVKEKSKLSLVEALDFLEVQAGPSASEKTCAQARPGPSRPSKRPLDEIECDSTDSESDEVEIQGRTNLTLFEALDFVGDSQRGSEPSKESFKKPEKSLSVPSITMVFHKSPTGDFEVSSSSEIKRSKKHQRPSIEVPDSTQKDVYDFTDEDSNQGSPNQPYIRSLRSPDQSNPDQAPSPKSPESDHLSRTQISTLLQESPDRGQGSSPCVQDKTQQPSSTQIILQPSQDSDSDSDIEIIDVIETKEEPVEPSLSSNLVISDVQGSVQEDLFQHNTEGFETQTLRFTGALTKLFVCDFCDTKFSGENFAIEHLKKFHKIPKNYQDYISIKKLNVVT